MLCKHIPDRYEHLVRYVGWYSNRARGERVKALSALGCEASEAQDPLLRPESSPEPVSAFAARSKANWAQLIQKVYEDDPLVCPKCKGPMRVIALIDDSDVVRRILEHLGGWAPEPTERGPPEAATDWPQNAVIPMTYHRALALRYRFVRLRRGVVLIVAALQTLQLAGNGCKLRS